MALKNLSVQDMVERTADLLNEGTTEHEALTGFQMGAAMLPQIQGSYDGLIASQPPDGSAVEALTRELTHLDSVHDELVRGIYGRFESEISFAIDEATRTRLAHARDAALPKGLPTIQLAYTEEAGDAKLRGPRVDEEVKTTLRKLTTYDGRTLEALYDQLQDTATTIGAHAKRRAELDDEAQLAFRTLDARNQWIRTINALAGVIAAAGLDERPILGRIRDAAAKAELSSPSKSSPSKSPPSVVSAGPTATPPVVAPTELDPPVPTDATDPSADPDA